jgi:hypothetical protein
MAEEIKVKTINKCDEEDLEFKCFVNRSHKLKWSWIIGVFVIVLSLLYGDTAELLLAGCVMVYLALTTINYFKSARKSG